MGVAEFNHHPTEFYCSKMESEKRQNSGSVCETTSVHQLLPTSYLMANVEAKISVWKCNEHQPKCCFGLMLMKIVLQMLQRHLN